MANEINSVIDKLTPLLSALAEKLGTTAEQVWALLVRQAILEGVSNAIYGLAWLVGLYVCVRIVKWGAKERDDDLELAPMVAVVVGGVCIVVFFIALVVDIQDAVKYLINPSYYALKEILAVLK